MGRPGGNIFNGYISPVKVMLCVPGNFLCTNFPYLVPLIGGCFTTTYYSIFHRNRAIPVIMPNQVVKFTSQLEFVVFIQASNPQSGIEKCMLATSFREFITKFKVAGIVRPINRFPLVLMPTSMLLISSRALSKIMGSPTCEKSFDPVKIKNISAVVFFIGFRLFMLTQN